MAFAEIYRMDNILSKDNILHLNELCQKLIQIFQDEEGLYLDLIKKEDLKKDAIIKRDADKLLKISREQEGDLKVVDLREKERSGIIQKISEIYSPGKSIEKLSDIAGIPRMDWEMKEKLLHHSYALRELMFTLKNISSTNQEMLEDNKRLFESLIEDLTADDGQSYGPEEKSKKSSGPVFVNLNG